MNGNGASKQAARFLFDSARAGEELVVEIEGLGEARLSID